MPTELNCMVIYEFMENSAPWVDCDTWNPLNRVLNREKLAAIEIATMYIEESSFSFKLGGSRRHQWVRPHHLSISTPVGR